MKGMIFLDQDQDGFEKKFISKAERFGLFATRPFQKREFLLFNPGKRISKAEADQQLAVVINFEMIRTLFYPCFHLLNFCGRMEQTSTCLHKQNKLFIDATDESSRLARYEDDSENKFVSVKALLFMDKV